MTGGAVCVVGSFMFDVVATASRRPALGETVIGTTLTTYVGGKGFNQAVAASRAGCSTTMVGRIGDDRFGADFRAFLVDEGIDDTHVRTDPENGTGVGLPVVQHDGQNSIVVVPRANLAVSLDDIHDARPVIEAASVLLLQLELPAAVTLRAAEIAHAAGTLVILNPAPFVEPSLDIARYVDVLVPNEGELAVMADLGARRGGVGSRIAQASSIGKRWGVTVVVTMGEAGVMLAPIDGQIETIDAHRVNPVDTVGAGDVFCGNLGAKLAGGAGLREAVVFANAAAAIAVTRRGGAPAAPLATETLTFLADAARSSDRALLRAAPTEVGEGDA